MQLTQFHHSVHCQSRVHCETCRADTPDAEAWRAAVAGAPAFSCPHGLPNGYRRPRGLGDTIEKATAKLGIKSCGGCKRRRDKLNKIIPYKRKQ